MGNKDQLGNFKADDVYKLVSSDNKYLNNKMVFLDCLDYVQ